MRCTRSQLQLMPQAGLQPGSSIFRPQTSNSTAAAAKSTSQRESDQPEHQTEFMLPRCPNSYAATPLLGGLCPEPRLTQKQKQMYNSCFAQNFNRPDTGEQFPLCCCGICLLSQDSSYISGILT